MGVGMSVIVPKEQVADALALLNRMGEDAYIIGEIVEGDEKIVIE
jgi:phosphoribosylformylglycinamidine cyclo-ligase